MTRLVVLTAGGGNESDRGYDVRLGPLAFVCPAAPVTHHVGQAVEPVGAILTPTEARPKPLKLSLAVRGASSEVDPRPVGLRQRRQLDQLLNNRRWVMQGLYFHWEADPELDGWLIVGGGELQDEDPGIVLGEWTLELSDVYVVGKPARARLGRRLELADRRTGLVPLDTRGVLYSTDHAAQALPARPLVIPGDVVGVLLTRNRSSASVQPGPQRGTRRLWRELAALDGDVASFLPDDGVLPDAGRRYLDVEEAGSVRAWDTSRTTVPLTESSWTAERDADPVLMGWERLYGTPLDRATPVAVDNGVCRLVWLGAATGQGLAIERYDDAAQRYDRIGRIAGAAGVTEVTIVELTQERAVIEWRGGPRALRAILQRGWYGPRVEAYNDDVGGTARLELVLDGGAAARAAGAPTWVESITGGGQTVLWAKGRDSDTPATFADGAGTFLGGAGLAYTSTGAAIVAQLGTVAGPTAAELASLAIADVQSVPVLVTR